MGRALLVSRVTHDLPLYPKDAQAKLIEGTQVTGERDKAREEIKREEGLAEFDRSQNPELRMIRGRRFFFEENYDAAATELKKAIEMDSTKAHYYVELGRILMRKQGGDEEAVTVLKKATTQSPDNPKLRSMLGQVLYRLKRTDESIGEFERAVKDTKVRNGEANFLLARIYRDDKKNLDGAVERFKKAAEDYYGDSMQVARSWDEGARTLEMKGDKTKAKDFYERAMAAESSFPDAICHWIPSSVSRGSHNSQLTTPSRDSRCFTH